MANITLRNVDDEVAARLRERAAANGRTVKAELEIILREKLHVPLNTYATTQEWLEAIRARFADVGGWDVEIPEDRLCVPPCPLAEEE